MTVGPWKPVYLHTYASRITDLRVTSEVLKTNAINITVDLAATLPTVSSSSGKRLRADVSLLHPDGSLKLDSKSAPFAESEGGKVKLSWSANPGDLELWWPVGYGEQPLYTVQVKLVGADETVVDVQNKRVGFRTARVVQETLKDEEGRSFFFEINGVPIFCGGSNWCVFLDFL